ncbi:hypothetical protein [Tardiphaga sp. 285_C5_N1_2]|uniref:hypothetical protein n=1 Tax=Tardiphaga sp. 285_C5_N1_2 TaxID=3240775 RepID=UPI003F8ACFB2
MNAMHLHAFDEVETVPEDFALPVSLNNARGSLARELCTVLLEPEVSTGGLKWFSSKLESHLVCKHVVPVTHFTGHGQFPSVNLALALGFRPNLAMAPRILFTDCSSASDDFAMTWAETNFHRVNTTLHLASATSQQSIAQQFEVVWASSLLGDHNVRIDPFSEYARFSVSNWDGQGASAICSDTLLAARTLLAALPRAAEKPDVAPAADGTIGFEWIHETGHLRKLFIDVGPQTIWRAYRKYSDGNYDHTEGRTSDENLAQRMEDLFEMVGG